LKYTAQDIANAVEGILHGDAELTISRLLLDTRRAQDASDSLFFAIKGDVHDGHKYIPKAIEKGVKLIVCEEAPSIPNVTFIVVKDSARALQAVASMHRSNFQYSLIAITGSNGKTIVKEWLNQLLAADEVVVRSPKSYNSQVGVPLSVWNMGSQHTLGLFEAGISQPGEMPNLQRILKPTSGIFTNVGSAHMENFDSLAQLAREKSALFIGAEKVIYRARYKEIKEALAKRSIPAISWGAQSECDYVIEKLSQTHSNTSMTIRSKQGLYDLSIPFGDDASFENAMHCIVYLLENGMDAEELDRRLKTLQPINMRLELIKGKRNSQIVSDVYSADLHSLEIALDFLARQHAHDQLVLIISDLIESGLESTQWLNKISQLTASAGISRVIAVGPEFSRHASDLEMAVDAFSTTEEALTFLENNPIADSDILIKGARKFGFERISKSLEARVSGTVLEINLDALTENLNHYRSLLKGSTKLMVMVKAFAYGSGPHEIARVLEFNQVDALGVAFIDEGVALREAGVSLPILVLNPEPSGYAELIQNRLEPEIFNFQMLQEFSTVLETLGHDDPYPIHIKIDSGMHRLGFDPSELDELAKVLSQNTKLAVKSVFSHLAASEDPGEDAFTRNQIEVFSAACSVLDGALDYSFDRHILNTAGIERFPEAHFDMVRLGIGLYGVSTTSRDQVRTVARLRSNISDISVIRAGESVGYNRSYKAASDVTIATIPIGYADGLDRRLSNGVGKMIVNGKPALIVGKVCMDMCMLDVSEITCGIGDEVEIFGENITITDLATSMGTIPYEVITGISLRVRRIFIQD
jgi:alanine racemase